MQNWTDEFSQTDPYLYRQKQNISIPLEDPQCSSKWQPSQGKLFLNFQHQRTLEENVLPAYELCINGAK